jgi:DNA repair protein RecO (recombination protein O)
LKAKSKGKNQKEKFILFSFFLLIFYFLPMIHKTKGIVLRTVKYGETSIIAAIYTELFGLQSYIVKGIRKAKKKGASEINYFQPAAILALEVPHNELKNLQFIKETQWAHLYGHIFFDVVKNAVAVYIVELLQHVVKQPEANTELFSFVEEALLLLDINNDTFAANLPLYFTIRLAEESGIRISGTYSEATPVLNLLDGRFEKDIPVHPHCLTGEMAELTSAFNTKISVEALANIHLNRNMRKELLHGYLQYLSLHLPDFGELRSVSVLQQVLS